LDLEDDASIVRRAFIPRYGHTFLMVDYDQMEYKLMLDYAGEMKVIEQVVNGIDVHTACGELMGVPRTPAKKINFMLLYGGGNAKLAADLGVSVKEATELRRLYFAKLPKVRKLIQGIQAQASKRGYIINWFGRRVLIPRDRAYFAPNMLIAGGCADVVKLAMVNLFAMLKEHFPHTQMLLQIHDEILFETEFITEGLIYHITKIMESAYKFKYLPLTCSVDYSERSWADKKPWPKNLRQSFEKALTPS